eukprot:365700-Chlamydomonas_euryale.AAC.12
MHGAHQYYAATKEVYTQQVRAERAVLHARVSLPSAHYSTAECAIAMAKRRHIHGHTSNRVIYMGIHPIGSAPCDADSYA